ncbi:MAG: alpha/beta hydrolase [Calditrichaeota bacterium]|nr:MAG: alpha/beta hydrolase [Calditrichota bacterium]
MTFLLLILWLHSACAPYGELRPMEFAELKYPFPVKTVTVDEDLTIAYVDEGEGAETIIFVHGLGSYLPAWQKNIADLRRDFRCLALDLPGYGKSSKGPYAIGMKFYAGVLARFMDALDIDRAVIAGHSMGGQIALTLALIYPERVSRLILAAPAGLEQFSEGEKKWFREVVTVESVKHTPVQQIRANIVRNFHNMPPDAEFMVTDRIALRGAKDFEWYCYAVVKSVQGMLDEPVYDRLEEIRQPTLIIFGENDNLIPNPYLHGGRSRDIARIGEEKIPLSEVVMIPGSGHFVQFEKPEAFNRAVRAFLLKE